MKYELQRTSQFKKDFKIVSKRGWDLDLLKQVVNILVDGKDLPEKFYDHSLSGDWKGFRECHIKPDWLLIYDIDDEIVTLYRTGSHSDIF